MGVLSEDDILLRIRLEADSIRDARVEIEDIAKGSTLDLAVDTRGIEKAVSQSLENANREIKKTSDTYQALIKLEGERTKEIKKLQDEAAKLSRLKGRQLDLEKEIQKASTSPEDLKKLQVEQKKVTDEISKSLIVANGLRDSILETSTAQTGLLQGVGFSDIGEQLEAELAKVDEIVNRGLDTVRIDIETGEVINLEELQAINEEYVKQVQLIEDLKDRFSGVKDELKDLPVFQENLTDEVEETTKATSRWEKASKRVGAAIKKNIGNALKAVAAAVVASLATQNQGFKDTFEFIKEGFNGAVGEIARAIGTAFDNSSNPFSLVNNLFSEFNKIDFGEIERKARIITNLKIGVEKEQIAALERQIENAKRYAQAQRVLNDELSTNSERIAANTIVANEDRLIIEDKIAVLGKEEAVLIKRQEFVGKDNRSIQTQIETIRLQRAQLQEQVKDIDKSTEAFVRQINGINAVAAAQSNLEDALRKFNRAALTEDGDFLPTKDRTQALLELREAIKSVTEAQLAQNIAFATNTGELLEASLASDEFEISNLDLSSEFGAEDLAVLGESVKVLRQGIEDYNNEIDAASDTFWEGQERQVNRLQTAIERLIDNGDGSLERLRQLYEEIEIASALANANQENVNDSELRLAAAEREGEALSKNTSIRRESLELARAENELEELRSQRNTIQSALDTASLDPISNQSTIVSLTADLEEINNKIQEGQTAVANAQDVILSRQISNATDYFAIVSNLFFQLTDIFTQEQIKRLDFEIEIQQRRVNEINRSVADGNAEQLQLEENRLNGLLDARERAARRQQQIAAIETAANQAVAVSAAIQGIVTAGATGGPGAALIIAAQVAAIITGIAAATAAINSAFGDIPNFYDGTDQDVQSSLGYKSGRDSHLVRVDNREKIVGVEDSLRVKHMSTKEMVNKALAYEKMAFNLPKNTIYRGNKDADYSKMVKATETLVSQNKKLLQALKHQGTEVIFDEKGLEVSTGKALARLERKRNQYKNDFKGSQGKTRRFRRRI